MVAPLRAITPRSALTAAWAGLVLLPLAWAVWHALRAGMSTLGWQHLWADPQTLPALRATLCTGLAATALAGVLSLCLLRQVLPGPHGPRWLARLPALLALPHVALALGLTWLLAPSGWLARALSPWATGWTAPPPWPTTQDPWGLGLVAALVAKEVPFLLWMAASQWQRPEAAQRWQREWQLARTLGHSPSSAWWRVLAPQWLALGRGPALAVLAYSLTVVDMALVVGPTSPPTLAVLAWQWLLDADPVRNTQGAAATLLLAGLVAVIAGLCVAIQRWPLCPSALTRWLTLGPRHNTAALACPTRPTILPKAWGWYVLAGLYLAVAWALLAGSVTGWWPFPALWPVQLSAAGWAAVAGLAGQPTVLLNTLGLACASASAAWLWTVVWLELTPHLPTPPWPLRGERALGLTLALPGLLWATGMHQLTLGWRWDLHWQGVWLAHTLTALPYVLLTLAPAYRHIDPRYRQLGASLGHHRWQCWWHILRPMLKAPLCAAWATGFAVSVAQYLPTLLVGGGRWPTLTTEALALSAGGQRTAAAAHATLLWLLPVLVFGAAVGLGRARFSAPPKSPMPHSTPPP